MRRLVPIIAALAVVIPFAGVASARTSNTPVLGPGKYGLRGAIGFGKVKPAEIYLGGDPSGLICRIHWITWGGLFAIGTGTALNAVNGVSNGTWAPAVVVLSRLGDDHGRAAYLSYHWSFPDGLSVRSSQGCRI
jgi:hypothetical protein